ncbi:MAG: hypothetical protein KDK24_16610 [Pseudooceanicola sp.]|nr:hypothetical protein [Pseudooceanicola sp.]
MKIPVLPLAASLLAATQALASESQAPSGHDAPAAHAPAPDQHAANTHATPAAPPPAPATDALCTGFGPQTPRDIAQRAGANPRVFSPAPPSTSMNLCNIHTHTNAEHKGPGFSVYAGDGEHGGYRCNETAALTDAELADPAHGHGGFHGVKPGDTLEVHWVYSSCEVFPGNGLGSCVPGTCANPQLRVESQVFLLVNDPHALQFGDYNYDGRWVDGRPQPRALPEGGGAPVVFAGSTTGPKYSQSVCSPLQVTWSVRPACLRLDIASLYAWGERGNVFGENHSHGVRQLVTAPELLAPMN